MFYGTTKAKSTDVNTHLVICKSYSQPAISWELSFQWKIVQPLYTVAKLNLGDRVLGEVEKNYYSFYH